MLSLNRKTDYALIALAYLADRGDAVASAREVAAACDVPHALLMNVLKTLHGHRLLRSARGVNGGYRIAADLDQVSLFDLIRALEKTERAGAAEGDEPPCCGRYKIDAAGAARGPVHAFHHKLLQFLQAVKLSDLVLPGRRIDVPLEFVSTEKNRPTPRTTPRALAGLS
jgi:Rrf2 family protein